jgi:hypothetical protein
MKTKVLAFAVLAYAMTWMALAPASAGGAGACVLGTGLDFNDGQGATTPYAGVNVGMNSETGVFTDSAAFQAACCAENGAPPDCFAPV